MSVQLPAWVTDVAEGILGLVVACCAMCTCRKVPHPWYRLGAQVMLSALKSCTASRLALSSFCRLLHVVLRGCGARGVVRGCGDRDGLAATISVILNTDNVLATLTTVAIALQDKPGVSCHKKYRFQCVFASYPVCHPLTLFGGLASSVTVPIPSASDGVLGIPRLPFMSASKSP